MAQKFRKKPVEVEAMRYGPYTEPTVGLVMFMAGCSKWSAGPNGLIIQTLEGDMRAEPGDWIVKGVKGEFYPVKHEIFVETYELIE